MHVAHEVVHMVDGLLAGLDDVIDAFVQYVQIEVGRHYGDFDQLVAAEDIQAGHLAVDPDQARTLRGVSFAIMRIYHHCLVSLLCRGVAAVRPNIRRYREVGRLADCITGPHEDAVQAEGGGQ